MSRMIIADDGLACFTVLGSAKSGNRGHKGRPGQKGGSGPGSNTDVETAIMGATNNERTMVSVEDTPLAKSAGLVVASTLREMREKGYTMPTMIIVGEKIGRSTIAGQVQQISGGTVKQGYDKDFPATTILEISLPEHAPPEMPLNTLVEKAFSGQTNGVDNFTARDFKDVVVHEMGHVQYGFDHDLSVPLHSAASQVSRYAGRNTNEFVAEAFTRLYRGETLQPEAAKLYDELNGPKLKAAGSATSGNRGHLGRHGEVGGSGQGVSGTTKQWLLSYADTLAGEESVRRTMPSVKVIAELAQFRPTHAVRLYRGESGFDNPIVSMTYDKDTAQGFGSVTSYMIDPKDILVDFTKIPTSLLSASEMLAATKDIQEVIVFRKGIRAAGSASSGNRGHLGRPGEVGGSGAGVRNARSLRALQAFVPVNATGQRYAEANELTIRNMVGGIRSDNNIPVDVITKIAGKTRGIEVKTMINNTNDKITMRHDALIKKAKWAAQNHARVSTVVLDDRGQLGHAHYSGHRIYFAKGAGSFRLSSMVKVTSAAHLKELLA